MSTHPTELYFDKKRKCLILKQDKYNVVMIPLNRVQELLQAINKIFWEVKDK